MGANLSRWCASKATVETVFKRNDKQDDEATPNNQQIVNEPKIAPAEHNVDDPLTRSLEHTYKMDHKNRGMAIIFNHENFDRKLGCSTRTGTQIDCENLKKTLKNLLFEVKAFKDLTLTEIKDELKKISEADHSDNDCIFITILSHGETVPFINPKTHKEFHTILAHGAFNYVYAKDTKYELQTIWKYFTDKMCPTLAKKPKIFVVQACQGDQYDPGFELKAMPMRIQTETDIIGFKPLATKPILPHADFLVAYSTMYGFYSFRNRTNGSWFIQSLCEELNKNDKNLDLAQLFMFATQRVAYNFESNSSDPDVDKRKQIPYFSSMLTKLVYFPDKEIKPDAK